MWDTFKIAQICYFSVASFLSSGNLYIFTVQGDSSCFSLFPALQSWGSQVFPGIQNYSCQKYNLDSCFKYTPKLWRKHDNFSYLLSRRHQDEPSEWVSWLSKCPPGGLSHQAPFGKSKTCSAFFFGALLLSGVGRNRSIASWGRRA